MKQINTLPNQSSSFRISQPGLFIQRNSTYTKLVANTDWRSPNTDQGMNPVKLVRKQKNKDHTDYLMVQREWIEFLNVTFSSFENNMNQIVQM